MGLQLFILCALYQAFNRTHVAIKMLSHRAHPIHTPPPSNLPRSDAYLRPTFSIYVFSKIVGIIEN